MGAARPLLVSEMKAAAFIFAALLVGCRVSAPAGMVEAGGSKLTQTGAAQVPASAETVTNRATIPLPKGTEIRVVPVFPDRPEQGFAFTLPEAAPLMVESTAERVKGPQAFTPPAPPSPAEISTGRAVLGYRIGLALGIAAAIFGLVRGWDLVMYGGGAIAAGCAFGLFVQSHPVLFALLGVGVALAVVGPWLWHSKLKKLARPESAA